jgi:hypothetical protein
MVLSFAKQLPPLMAWYPETFKKISQSKSIFNENNDFIRKFLKNKNNNNKNLLKVWIKFS